MTGITNLRQIICNYTTNSLLSNDNNSITTTSENTRSQVEILQAYPHIQSHLPLNLRYQHFSALLPDNFWKIADVYFKTQKLDINTLDVSQICDKKIAILKDQRNAIEALQRKVETLDDLITKHPSYVDGLLEINPFRLSAEFFGLYKAAEDQNPAFKELNMKQLDQFSLKQDLLTLGYPVALEVYSLKLEEIESYVVNSGNIDPKELACMHCFFEYQIHCLGIDVNDDGINPQIWDLEGALSTDEEAINFGNQFKMDLTRLFEETIENTYTNQIIQLSHKPDFTLQDFAAFYRSLITTLKQNHPNEPELILDEVRRIVPYHIENNFAILGKNLMTIYTFTNSLEPLLRDKLLGPTKYSAGTLKLICECDAQLNELVILLHDLLT